MPGRRKPITWEVDANGCWNCTSHTPNTHGYPMLSVGNKGEHMHRVLYEEKNGELPAGLVVRHTCDNRRCINPNHWVPGTPKENSEDMRSRGRCNTHRGETRSDAKLSAENVETIRAANCTQRELAERFGVNQATISRIRSGQNRQFG